MIKFNISEPKLYHLVKCGVVVYVGQSKGILGRLNMHKAEKTKDFDSVSLLECMVDDLGVTELLHIIKFRPKYNVNIPYVKCVLSETKVKVVIQSMKDAGIPFDMYDINKPVFSFMLGDREFKMWPKADCQQEFNELIRMIKAMGVKDV